MNTVHTPLVGGELRKIAALAGFLGDTLPGERIEHRENLRWAFEKTGPAWADVGRGYIDVAHKAGWVAASRKLQSVSPLVRHDLYLAADDSDIRAFCDRRARECAEIFQGTAGVLHGLRSCSGVVDRYGLHWPAPHSRISGPSIDLMPLVSRLCCALWWRRQVRRLQAREVDQLARTRRQVAKYRQAYCSDFVVRQRRAAEVRNAETLSQTFAVNDDGQEYSIGELSALGVSNPANRRGELMTRIRGFETVAAERGHVAEFWTFTTASKWHRMRWLPKAKKAVPVETWNGSTPRQVQDWLCILWSRIRADLARQGVRIYGFRVVEPHHDGTPHWHLLIFLRESERRLARKVCRAHLLSDDGAEKGAWRARFVAKKIDPAKGSASGYIAKYIAKNVDGRGVHGSLKLQDDDSGLALHDAAERARAWAAAWGIRQFQQIGGPSVTVWRELRRLWSESEPATDDLFGNLAVEAAGEAADAGDWAAYVEYMGGPTLPRADRPCRPGYWIDAPAQIDEETGEEMPVLTRYGDESKGSVFGVIVAGGGAVLTRFYRWCIEHRPARAPDIHAAAPIGSDDRLLGDVDVRGGVLAGLVSAIFGPDREAGGPGFAPPAGGALEFCQ